ncbi:FAD-dependent oxidoreductase [Streptomyces sp. MST-110588]|uniref:FAD-dependent oxidoreductase n=1 Tax=Streptomyces sp. MST-110588 TaxID=2833628 RepID=UPI001F5CFAE3|nr:FAD-dependent oxidoreductase [Streptomyces sp. MST-110588]UNO41249.1 FAD-dependent oxidoreductase [Streptomyces sp. MST-110588]
MREVPVPEAPVREVPVLVVGGSLTGLSAALFLGMHGVPALVVERRPDVLAHPRLRGMLPRAMELFRQAGAEQAIRAVCPEGPDADALVSIAARTLSDEHELLTEARDNGANAGTAEGASTDDGAGEALANHAQAPAPTPTPDEDLSALVSPCAFAPVAQNDLEAVLLEHAAKAGAEIRFGTRLTGFEQDPDGVTVRLRGPDGAPETVRARYLIAADGASSTVRKSLGIGSAGPGTLFHMATMNVRADFSEALRGRPVGMAYLTEPGPGTTLGPLDGTGLHWFFGTSRPPEEDGRGGGQGDGKGSVEGTGTNATSPGPEDPVSWVRAATGLPTLDVELIDQIPGSGRKVFTFPVGARVAERYAVGRVFLAGDAAHLMPPTGSLGGLTCVEDAHNLAWKLALVLRGDAGPGLLDTYETERRPVADRNMRQAVARGRTRWRFPGYENEELLDFYAVTYGTRYRSRAVPGAPYDDAGTAPPLRLAELTGVPGSRAPHVFVSQNDEAPLSTLDLYGRDLVLLVGPDGDPWAAAAERAARLLSVPVEVYHLDMDLAAPHGLGPRGALLIRPDGYCAWRSQSPQDHPGTPPDTVLEHTLRTLLHR